jgi:hypothetical protein
MKDTQMKMKEEEEEEEEEEETWLIIYSKDNSCRGWGLAIYISFNYLMSRQATEVNSPIGPPWHVSLHRRFRTTDDLLDWHALLDRW